LSYHVGMKFSTKDQDNDLSSKHCASKGGWWYNDCLHSNLNGLYLDEKNRSSLGIVWKTWKGMDYSLEVTEMKIKPYVTDDSTSSPTSSVTQEDTATSSSSFQTPSRASSNVLCLLQCHSLSFFVFLSFSQTSMHQLF